MKDIDLICKELGIPRIEFEMALNLLPPCPATTVQEARVEFHRFSLDYPEKRAALAKWNELSLIDVAIAKTIHEVKKVRDEAPERSEAEMAATRKIYELWPEE